MYLTEYEIHAVVDENLHLFPKLLLYVFLGVGAEVGGCLADPAQSEGVTFGSHLLC